MNNYTFQKEFKFGTKIYHQDYGELFLLKIYKSLYGKILGIKFITVNYNEIKDRGMENNPERKNRWLVIYTKFLKAYNDGDFYKL